VIRKPIAQRRDAALKALDKAPAGMDRLAIAKAIGLSGDRTRRILHSLRNDGLVFVTLQGGRGAKWARTEHRALALPPPVIKPLPPKPIHAPPPSSVFHWRP
jgi:predicted ArsR family transcriptional regulator